jgi:hypothetical protein
MSLEFAAIAQKHFGAPNKSLSSKTELRFGTHGSKSVNLKTGVWFDHESNDGGSLYSSQARDGLTKRGRTETGRRIAMAAMRQARKTQASNFAL